MRKNHLTKAALAVLLTLSLSGSVTASKNDVTNDPQNHFLTYAEAPNSLELLPPPPQPGSEQFKNDEDRYQWGLTQRDTARGKLASSDADNKAKDVAKAFSESFGMNISPKDTPMIFRLLQRMREDAGDLATDAAKNHYLRTRPFVYYKTNTCSAKDEKRLSKNGSYPSGHTAIGWATALVLAEINPKRQTEILKRGYEIGQSRVICGYHWQSDVDAGRLMGAAVVAALHNNPVFQWHLMMAKEEFQKLSAAQK